MQKYGRNVRAGEKDAIKLVALLERIQKALDGFHPVRAMGLTADEMALLQPLQLLTAKPALYIANVDEQGFENNPLLDRVREYAKKEGAPVVAICAKLEAEIADLSGEEKEDVPRRHGPHGAGIEPTDPRHVRPAGPADLLHRGTEGGARVDRARRAPPRRRPRA